MCKKCDPKTCKGCVQVYLPIAGWKAVMMIPELELSPDGTEVLDAYCVPEQTGFVAYKNKEGAVAYAKSWAKDEELIFNG